MVSDALMQSLQSVRHLMFGIQKNLLTLAKRDREVAEGRNLTPSEWFQVLLGAPEYQWLKVLNSLIADIDALIELKTIQDSDLSIVSHELERLFFVEDDDVTSFNSHYRKFFSTDHDLILMHGQMKEQWSHLPKGRALPTDEEVRRGWHRVGSSKRKLLN